MSDDKTLNLFAYPVGGGAHENLLRPAERIRPWQLATRSANATRCLPLNIANCHGWEAVCPGGFDAIWDGGVEVSSIEVVPHGDGACVGQSHFGEGILTMMLGVLFRTSPGHNLMVMGPINEPKDKIQALTGIMETDWAPYSLTMNWKFTSPGRVQFNKGDAFCHFFPIPRGYMEAFSPEYRDYDKQEPESEKEYKAWSASRDKFNADLYANEPAAVKQGWQKLYYRGLRPDGVRKQEDHQIKLTPKPFKNESSFDFKAGEAVFATLDLPVSACVATLNDASNIRRYLDSVAPHLKEVVILDLGSVDETVSIIKSSPFKNVRVLTATKIDPNTPTLQILANNAKQDTLLLLQPEDRLLPEFWQQAQSNLNEINSENAVIQMPLKIAAFDFEPVKMMLADMHKNSDPRIVATEMRRFIFCKRSFAQKANIESAAKFIDKELPVISVYAKDHKTRSNEYLLRKLLAEVKLGQELDQQVFATLAEGLSQEEIGLICQEIDEADNHLPHDHWWGQKTLAAKNNG